MRAAMTSCVRPVATRGVPTRPTATALTRMPGLPWSSAAVLVSPAAPCLAATWPANPGTPARLVPEPTSMTAPDFRCDPAVAPLLSPPAYCRSILVYRRPGRLADMYSSAMLNTPAQSGHSALPKRWTIPSASASCPSRTAVSCIQRAGAAVLGKHPWSSLRADGRPGRLARRVLGSALHRKRTRAAPRRGQGPGERLRAGQDVLPGPAERRPCTM